MSLRRAVARPAGAGDLLDEAVRYQVSLVLSDAQKSALDMHDAFLANPSGFPPEARARVLEHFSPEQIVELVFKFLWWSTNRATVVLGGDAPHDPDRLTSFHYDEHGEYVVDAGVR